jgi:N-acetylmuramoyl-L-alanine amidase
MILLLLTALLALAPPALAQSSALRLQGAGAPGSVTLHAGHGFPAAPAPRAATPAPPARVVILDAGHGGPDPGRIGPNRLREKDVTLSLVRRLGAILAERGYEVHYTRTTDTLIALADRPRLANQWKAGRPSALFLSIHANAGPSKATGFETFFLSDARTEDERRVAEMENAAVEYERNGDAAALPEIDQIFNSLRNDFYIHASNDLAEAVQARLAAFHPGPNRGVKQAGFRVLVGAFMPAVLIEVAFISNAGEARLLGTASFQQKLARAIADAVDRFFDGHEHLWDIPETASP